jgi:hypothetical protein
MEKQNRRITNYLDDNLTPESDTVKLVLIPVAIPIGTFSLLSDTFLVQPLIALPKAIEGTLKYIWSNPQGGAIVQSFLFIPKVIFTPVTFGVLWIRHAFFFGS